MTDLTTKPLPIGDERWSGDLAYLGDEIPVGERPRWRVSPVEMNFTQAKFWAREVLDADKIMHLSSGETLLRLPLSPWALPE